MMLCRWTMSSPGDLWGESYYNSYMYLQSLKKMMVGLVLFPLDTQVHQLAQERR